MLHRLLIVEDDPADLRLYLRALEPLFRVATARSVAEARRRLATTPADALVLNWRPSDGSGLSFIDELRSSQDHRDLTIVVTGHPGRERCLEALRAGADEFLPKPVDLEILVARLDGMKRRRASFLEDARAFSCDGLTYEPGSRQVFLNRRRVPLHPKELKLFEVFLEYPDRVLSPERLWSAVWGARSARWAHTLRRSLYRLRRALGPWGRHLETRKGVGYLLCTKPGGI